MSVDPVSDDRIVWLHRGGATRPLVGGKGESLSQLSSLGAPVPPAFALSTRVYREFAATIGLPEHATDVADADLARIREEIERAPLPPELAALLGSAFAALAEECGREPVLAVRSSATTEDSAERSFAGLHDTLLDVRGPDELEHAVKRCWASLWSERAVVYRRAGDLAMEPMAIAVVVQELVPSDTSFVVFTVDPIHHNGDHLIIAATWGLGEAVVSGLVVPDHVVIGPDGEVLAYTTGDKHCMVIPGRAAGEGAREVPVPRMMRSTPALSHEQAREIGVLARSLSHRLGFPADIEGAFAGGRLYVLQARPITTLDPDTRGDRQHAHTERDSQADLYEREEGETSMVVERQPHARTFPVDWNTLAEGEVAFQFDAMHFPFPVTPLTHSALNDAFSAGFTAAAHEHQAPIAEVQARDVNWFHYERYLMHHPATEDEAREMGEQAEATAKMEIGRLGDRWANEHLPAVRAHLRRLAELERAVATASADEIAGAIDEVQAIHRELWTIHFRIALPMLLAMQIFDEFYTEVFEAGEAEAHTLLRGVASESINAGFGLHDLADEARSLGLEATIRETPTEQLRARLQSDPAAQPFFAHLDAYLERYGLRQDLFDLATPTWRESPELALSAVRTYLATGRDERAEYEAIARSADVAVAGARARLAAYPEAVRGQFEGLLAAARTASFLQEEHNFYIDQQGLSRLRLFFLAVGRALVERGVLEQADDVFLFTRTELKELLGAEDERRRDRARTLARQRRDELATARTLQPPPFIGPPPAGPPPDNPMTRGLMRFFGGPPAESGASDRLKGNPGSRGIVSGPARVVKTLEEATRIQPGEVLVAVTTMPPWTPLFAIAAAVVTETGGPLSHCAIVAREYGIPAVVGVAGATRVIANGRRITVDGGQGMVLLEG